MQTNDFNLSKALIELEKLRKTGKPQIKFEQLDFSKTGSEKKPQKKAP